MSTTAMKVYAAANLAAGTAMALLASSPWAGAALQLAEWVQPAQAAATADQPVARWVMGIAGGVWAGWGATMLASVAGAPPAAAILRGLVVWCALDSVASVATGAALNVGVNGVWLALGWLALGRAPRS